MDDDPFDLPLYGKRIPAPPPPPVARRPISPDSDMESDVDEVIHMDERNTPSPACKDVDTTEPAVVQPPLESHLDVELIDKEPSFYNTAQDDDESEDDDDEDEHSHPNRRRRRFVRVANDEDDDEDDDETESFGESRQRGWRRRQASRRADKASAVLSLLPTSNTRRLVRLLWCACAVSGAVLGAVVVVAAFKVTAESPPPNIDKSENSEERSATSLQSVLPALANSAAFLFF